MNPRDPGAPPQIWNEADGLHIDVRGLPPPQPLVEIMRWVAASTDGAPIIVHHDRDPVLLYPELLQAGWWAERIDGPPGQVVLRLTPGP